MPELIERGYIYIGLPPLYKIKQGKSEIYLKDDAALNVYLANNAVEGASLIPAESEPAIEGAALEKLLLAYAGARDTIARNAHRFDPLVLESLIDFTRSEEHTSELQSLMRISYAVFCLKKKKITNVPYHYTDTRHTITPTSIV